MTRLHCDFCYLPVATQLRRARRGLVDMIARRPAPTTDVCELHVGKGLDHIRSARLGLALIALRGAVAVSSLNGLKYLAGWFLLLVAALKSLMTQAVHRAR